MERKGDPASFQVICIPGLNAAAGLAQRGVRSGILTREGLRKVFGRTG